MKRRLEKFPATLETHFEDILRRIDPIYLKETACIFLVTLEAVGPLPLLALQYLSTELHDPEYALKAPIRPVGKKKQMISFANG
jgi:hypothetical protein